MRPAIATACNFLRFPAGPSRKRCRLKKIRVFWVGNLVPNLLGSSTREDAYRRGQRFQFSIVALQRKVWLLVRLTLRRERRNANKSRLPLFLQWHVGKKVLLLFAAGHQFFFLSDVHTRSLLAMATRPPPRLHFFFLYLNGGVRNSPMEKIKIVIVFSQFQFNLHGYFDNLFFLMHVGSFSCRSLVCTFVRHRASLILPPCILQVFAERCLAVRALKNMISSSFFLKNITEQVLEYISGFCAIFSK